jgi:hypothetical protein
VSRLFGQDEVYRVETPPVIGVGVRLKHEDFTAEVVQRLKSLHRLEPQKAEIAGLVRRMAETEFASDRLRLALESGRLDDIERRFDAVKPPEEDWRLGETLGREYLQQTRDYHFPIVASQDARNQDGSLPGTDYVGFRMAADGLPRFAFGEVKTSSADRRPPSVMSGSTGLVEQLIDLMPDEKGAWDQIQYLGDRAKGQPWQLAYAEAFAALDEDDLDFDLVGVLVRPRPTHDEERLDLQNRCAALAAKVKPLKRGALLLALYVPPATFSGLRKKWAT